LVEVSDEKDLIISWKDPLAVAYLSKGAPEVLGFKFALEVEFDA